MRGLQCVRLTTRWLYQFICSFLHSSKIHKKYMKSSFYCTYKTLFVSLNYRKLSITTVLVYEQTETS